MPRPASRRTTMFAFSAVGKTDACVVSRRMSRPDAGFAITPTVMGDGKGLSPVRAMRTIYRCAARESARCCDARYRKARAKIVAGGDIDAKPHPSRVTALDVVGVPVCRRDMMRRKTAFRLTRGMRQAFRTIVQPC